MIEDVSFLESIPLWAVTLLGSLFIWGLSLVMILTVYAFLTVNLPKEPLQANEAFIKDFDENTGLLDFVLKNQLGTLCPERGCSGRCSYPKIAFDMEKLREFDPEGTEKYLHRSQQKNRSQKRKER